MAATKQRADATEAAVAVEYDGVSRHRDGYPLHEDNGEDDACRQCRRRGGRRPGRGRRRRRRISSVCIAAATLAATAGAAAAKAARSRDDGGGSSAPPPPPDPPLPSKRIVGGTESTPLRYPYMASLQTASGGHSCGGTLVASDFVLSAAHCRGAYSRVAVGFHDMNDIEEGVYETYGVAEEVPHPEYRYTPENMDINYDFMLVRLKTKVANARPVRLNDAGDLPAYAGESLTVVGWGTVDVKGTVLSDTLREVELSYITNDACESSGGWIKGRYYSYDGFIADNMLCAGAGPEGEVKDACLGDSGGPILLGSGVDGAAEADLQAGIVSFGVGCANPDFPGIYARISDQISWIAEVVCAKSVDPPAYLCGGEGGAVNPPPAPTTAGPTRGPTPWPTAPPPPTPSPTAGPTPGPTPSPATPGPTPSPVTPGWWTPTTGRPTLPPVTPGPTPPPPTSGPTPCPMTVGPAPCSTTPSSPTASPITASPTTRGPTSSPTAPSPTLRPTSPPTTRPSSAPSTEAPAPTTAPSTAPTTAPIEDTDPDNFVVVPVVSSSDDGGADLDPDLDLDPLPDAMVRSGARSAAMGAATAMALSIAAALLTLPFAA